MTVTEGTPAPDFSLPADGGGTVASGDFKGKALVLYFYPKDSTPGCTAEAVDFTAHLADFEAAGAAVVGISKDSVARHDAFKVKAEIGFPLASDQDGGVCELFGVWTLKKNYGREYMGIERSTFLIDGQGTVRRVWRKVRVKGHALDVLNAVRALGSGG